MKISLGIFISFSLLIFACTPSKNATVQTATLMTSAQCGMCKTTIEGALKTKEGIKWVVLEPEIQKLTVKFDNSKISLSDIKQTVSAAGYDAGDVKADPKAYEGLPACCQKGGHH